MHSFIFGVFNADAKPVFVINKVRCTHEQAGFIVALLDKVARVLAPGHYFACDYA